jgi:hypothetical protein
MHREVDRYIKLKRQEKKVEDFVIPRLLEEGWGKVGVIVIGVENIQK